MKRSLIIQLLLLAAAAAFGIHLYIKYRVAPDIAFSSLKLTDLNGKQVTMNDYRGKVVVLDFWATWCPACVTEMPSMVRAQELLKDENIQFLFVTDEDASKVQGFSERRKFPLQYVLSAQHFEALGVNSLPTTYIIGKDGKVLFTEVGAENWADPDMVDKLRGLAKQ